MPLYTSLNNPLSEGDQLSNEMSAEDLADLEDQNPPILSPSHLGKTLQIIQYKFCPKGHKMRNQIGPIGGAKFHICNGCGNRIADIKAGRESE